MIDKLLHTPEGVRDIYDSECKRKIQVERKLQQVLELYGYRQIQTPTFEFFDIFNHEKGTVSSKEMYKFFDRENNTLVLRPDMTPSIARCVAQYYGEEQEPIRLSYKGSTFINNSRYQGKLKETTQLGCELINDDSSAADAEILAMVIHCLKAAGLTEFQVSVGQVDFFRGLMEEAGLSHDVEEQIRLAIETKNYFAVSNLIETLHIGKKIADILLQFQELYGGLEILEKAKTLTQNQTSIKAIERLEKVYRTLTQYGLEDAISFDLSMLSQYQYYTGIIFKGYTYGTGDAIVKGGRYDDLLAQFGKDAPSIGFAFVVDELMMALSRQKLNPKIEDTNTLILYQAETQEQAVKLAMNFRNQGLVIELLRQSSRKSLDYYKDYAKKHHIGGMLYLQDDGKIQVMNMTNDDLQVVEAEEFLKGM